MNKLLVTVIIPTYNRAKTIERSINSVLSQSYSNLELIVVDDGSSDNTKSVVENIDDSRVRYIWQNNSGACAARNNGINNARGEYIAFNDSDDTWKPNKLEKQLEVVTKTGADVVFCKLSIPVKNGYKKFQPEGINEGFVNFRKNSVAGIGTQTLFFKKEVLTEFKFDEKIPRFQDLEILINIMNSGKYSLYCINESLLDDYEMSEDSISINPTKLITALEILEKKYPNLRDMSPALSRDISGYFRFSSKVEVKKKKYFKAMKYEFKAITYEEKNKILYPWILLRDVLRFL